MNFQTLEDLTENRPPRSSPANLSSRWMVPGQLSISCCCPAAMIFLCSDDQTDWLVSSAGLLSEQQVRWSVSWTMCVFMFFPPWSLIPFVGFKLVISQLQPSRCCCCTPWPLIAVCWKRWGTLNWPSKRLCWSYASVPWKSWTSRGNALSSSGKFWEAQRTVFFFFLRSIFFKFEQTCCICSNKNSKTYVFPVW